MKTGSIIDAYKYVALGSTIYKPRKLAISMLLNAYSRSHVPLLTLPPLSTVFHLTVQYHIYCFTDLLDAGCEGIVFCLFEVLKIEPRALYALGKGELF